MSMNGKISQVMGAVVDVVFEDGHLPDIYNALNVDSGEQGTFNLGNLKITINSLKTFERDLIICKS